MLACAIGNIRPSTPAAWGMHAFLESGPPGGSFTGMVDQLGSDGAITGMTTPAWKQPYTGLSSQPVPVSSEFVEQLWAEQHIPVFAVFAALDGRCQETGRRARKKWFAQLVR
jgi:hypothetical protein